MLYTKFFKQYAKKFGFIGQWFLRRGCEKSLEDGRRPTEAFLYNKLIFKTMAYRLKRSKTYHMCNNF